ncbi:uncharacterized protein LOC135399877 [Ornithodoros turicata]|uniref:uncharacterized protein LOC135399877 n=1 Tax=Ornithodoros turicata TaxID=34597 RepID=UPI003139BACA
MVYCAIVGCNSRTQSKQQKIKSNEKDPSFFKIPKVRMNECEKTRLLSERRRREWLARIKRAGIAGDPDKYKVCSRHFLSGSPSGLFDDCNPDWAPSLHLGYNAEPAHDGRYKRLMARHSRSRQAPPDANQHVDISPETAMDITVHDTDVAVDECDMQQGNFTAEPVSGMSCQTDMTADHIHQLEVEVASLRKEMRAAKEDLLASKFTEEALRDDDEKVSFYSGLPSFLAILSLFHLLKDHVAHSSRNVLSQFEEMMMFLIRIRLGIHMQDLAYRFNVSQSTASRICEKWLDVSYDRLGHLVHWPDKENIMKTMPAAFVENFGFKARVILDCFEVFIQRPSSLITRAETWSQYKHHNTVKFLLGISPQGMVTFLSRAYGGRASDKAITEQSGVLQLLEYGDVVLADRGFLIAESVGMCCATLAVPTFTKGKRQLSSYEVEQTREIANVRIHVERVIGMVRNKYRILKSTIPVELLRRNSRGESAIDKIVKVCCSLTNLCNSVVSFD